MPRRDDLRSVLVLGSGPIVIGQACEFDYSGTQACKVLREEGLRVVLVNSNPATIMTDPALADATYVEPLTLDAVRAVIDKERPDALLATLGGQTALNLAVELHEAGVLEAYGVEVLGADLEAIQTAEDRQRFKDAMTEIGLESPRSTYVKDVDGALAALEHVIGVDALPGAHVLDDLLRAEPAPVVERIADHTVNIAKHALSLNDEPELELNIDIARMASLVQQMLIDGLDAFTSGDPERARAMGAAGRQRVIEEFSWASVAERTVELYRELVGG